MASRVVRSAIAGSLIALTAAANGPVSAAGSAGTFASEPTQLLNNIELLLQTIEQYQQTIHQAEILGESLIQGEQVNQHLFDNQSMMVIEQVHQAVSEGLSLGYAAENLEARFAERYPDYEEYIGEEYGVDAYMDDYAHWSRTTMQSIQTALTGVGIQMESIHEEEEVMAQMREMAANAETRQQALQTANMIATTTAQQMQKLRQVIAINGQVQTGYIAEMQAEKNVTRAKKHRYFNPENKDGPVLGNSQGVPLF